MTDDMTHRYLVVMLVLIVYVGLFIPYFLTLWQQRREARLAEKRPPEFAELLARLDRDVAAVIEDAQAIRRYGESQVTANGASSTEGNEPALQVTAP